MEETVKKSATTNKEKVEKNIKSFIFMFFVMGFINTNIELLFRGYTHPSMLIVGGLCGAFIGLLNEKNHNVKIWQQCFLGTIIILLLEFISGYIINIKLGLGVWDYSGLRFNLLGQVSLLFGVLWFFLCVPIIWLDDYLRFKFFHSNYYGSFQSYLIKFITLK